MPDRDLPGHGRLEAAAPFESAGQLHVQRGAGLRLFVGELLLRGGLRPCGRGGLGGGTNRGPRRLRGR